MKHVLTCTVLFEKCSVNKAKNFLHFLLNFCLFFFFFLFHFAIAFSYNVLRAFHLSSCLFLSLCSYGVGNALAAFAFVNAT